MFSLFADTMDSARVIVTGPFLYVIGVALTIVSAVASWAIVWLQKKLSADTGATIKNSLFAEVFSFADLVVHELEATVRTDLGKMSADGSLSDVEIKQIRDDALKRLKDLLGTEGLARVQKVFGLGLTQLDGFLRGLLEKSAAKLPPTTAPVVVGSIAQPLKPTPSF